MTRAAAAAEWDKQAACAERKDYEGRKVNGGKRRRPTLQASATSLKT